MTEKALALQLADDLEIDYAGEVVPHKSAAALRRLHAENERLHRHELANNLWHEKTDWLPETAQQPLELGRHRADVLKQRIERLHAVNAELLEALRMFVNCALPVPGAGTHWTEGWLDQALPIARAAIAKAEGEKT
jgi:hypothetical protein